MCVSCVCMRAMIEWDEMGGGGRETEDIKAALSVCAKVRLERGCSVRKRSAGTEIPKHSRID